MTHLGTITATVALETRPQSRVARVLAWMRSIERTVKDVRVQ